MAAMAIAARSRYRRAMYEFAPENTANKPALYAALCEAALAITADEPDAIANMANIAALIDGFLPDLNWAGFYRNINGQLVLGPFIGKPACIRIALGSGVCGTAAAEARSVLVEDVHAFPGHIACDAVSRSELVVPVIRDGTVIAVIDCDSPQLARFDEADRDGLEQLAAAMAPRI